MTKARALELIKLSNDWPYWGQFSRFMTADERHYIHLLWSKAPPSWSTSDVIFALSGSLGPDWTPEMLLTGNSNDQTQQ